MTTSYGNKEVGAAIAAARGPLTQQNLADLMRGRGFAWAQATAWKVEIGDRPLRLVEAVALAEILNVPLTLLAGLPGSEDANVQRQLGYDRAMKDVAEFVRGRGEFDA